MDEAVRKETPPPVVIPRPDHNVSRSGISKNALKVMYRLKEGGYKAFMVGGGVRDLLLGREPKDFDIVTDAHPEDVRRLFRNCRLIGRRFRLAHVFFGREVIEVATFRAAHDGDDEPPEGERLLDADGRILRDNIYGDIDEDIWRRDFTANALYYNIADFSIWDYSGGVEDVRHGVLRLIGDPEGRYREDPVRMLRAVRFAAKLGFRIDPASEAPLGALGELIGAMPPARLYDETLKLFLSGHAVQSYELLRHYGLFRHLFPAADAELDAEEGDTYRQLVLNALESTDRRVARDKPVTPVFLFAVLLWGPVRALAMDYQEEGDAELQALWDAADDVFREQQQRIAIPRRISTPAREVMIMQPRFGRRRGKRVLRLLEHPRFRAAYDLLVLRTETGEEDPETARFWTDLQNMAPDDQSQAVGAGKSGSGRRRRRPRRRSRGPKTPRPTE